MKILGLMLLVIGMSGAAMAQIREVPEIAGGSAAGALCLLSGAIVLVRSRLKK